MRQHVSSFPRWCSYWWACSCALNEHKCEWLLPTTSWLDITALYNMIWYARTILCVIDPFDSTRTRVTVNIMITSSLENIKNQYVSTRRWAFRREGHPLGISSRDIIRGWLIPGALLSQSSSDFTPLLQRYHFTWDYWQWRHRDRTNTRTRFLVVDVVSWWWWFILDTVPVHDASLKSYNIFDRPWNLNLASVSASLIVPLKIQFSASFSTFYEKLKQA
jgi:hypothetical protein